MKMCFLQQSNLLLWKRGLAWVDALSDDAIGDIMDGFQRVLSLSLPRYSSWKVLCTIQLKLPLPTLEAAKQYLTHSFTFFQKLPTFTTPCLLVIIGIFQVGVSTIVATAMVTMESKSVNFPRLH